MTWTPERLAALHRLWGTRPAREIGELTGKTRNAVIGKARRERLTMTPKQLEDILEQTRVRGSKPRRVIEVSPPPKDGITLADLTEKRCAFPIHDKPFRCCGKGALEGRSYCPEHYKLCHDQRRAA